MLPGTGVGRGGGGGGRRSRAIAKDARRRMISNLIGTGISTALSGADLALKRIAQKENLEEARLGRLAGGSQAAALASRERIAGGGHDVQREGIRSREGMHDKGIRSQEGMQKRGFTHDTAKQKRGIAADREMQKRGFTHQRGTQERGIAADRARQGERLYSREYLAEKDREDAAAQRLHDLHQFNRENNPNYDLALELWDAIANNEGMPLEEKEAAIKRVYQEYMIAPTAGPGAGAAQAPTAGPGAGAATAPTAGAGVPVVGSGIGAGGGGPDNPYLWTPTDAQKERLREIAEDSPFRRSGGTPPAGAGRFWRKAEWPYVPPATNPGPQPLIERTAERRTQAAPPPTQADQTGLSPRVHGGSAYDLIPAGMGGGASDGGSAYDLTPTGISPAAMGAYDISPAEMRRRALANVGAADPLSPSPFIKRRRTPEEMQAYMAAENERRNAMRQAYTGDPAPEAPPPAPEAPPPTQEAPPPTQGTHLYPLVDEPALTFSLLEDLAQKRSEAAGMGGDSMHDPGSLVVPPEGGDNASLRDLVMKDLAQRRVAEEGGKAARWFEGRAAFGEDPLPEVPIRPDYEDRWEEDGWFEGGEEPDWGDLPIRPPPAGGPPPFSGRAVVPRTLLPKAEIIRRPQQAPLPAQGGLAPESAGDIRARALERLRRQQQLHLGGVPAGGPWVGR